MFYRLRTPFRDYTIYSFTVLLQHMDKLNHYCMDEKINSLLHITTNKTIQDLTPYPMLMPKWHWIHVFFIYENISIFFKAEAGTAASPVHHLWGRAKPFPSLLVQLLGFSANNAEDTKWALDPHSVVTELFCTHLFSTPTKRWKISSSQLSYSHHK